MSRHGAHGDVAGCFLVFASPATPVVRRAASAQFPLVRPRSARLRGVPLLLVRHAHAHARKEWSGDDRLRPLSANGLRQAEGLIAVFGNFARPSRVLSSPYLRCMQTVEPLRRRPTTSTWSRRGPGRRDRAPAP